MNKQITTYKGYNVEYRQVEGGYNYMVEFGYGGATIGGAETLEEMWERIDAAIASKQDSERMDFIIDATNGNFPND